MSTVTPQQLRRLGRRTAATLAIALLLLNLVTIGFLYFRGWEKGPSFPLPAPEAVTRVSVRRGSTGPWSELSRESGRELVRVLSNNWKFIPTRPICILGPIPPHFEVRVEEVGGRCTMLGLGERCCAITTAWCSPVNGAPTRQVLLDPTDTSCPLDETAYPRAFAIVSAALPPAEKVK